MSMFCFALCNLIIYSSLNVGICHDHDYIIICICRDMQCQMFLKCASHVHVKHNINLSLWENAFLKAYKLSELIFFLFMLKVANIRCFILIKCSEQEARFKKYVIKKYNVIISEKKSNVCCVGEIAINTPNYKSASFPKFAGHW